MEPIRRPSSAQTNSIPQNDTSREAEVPQRAAGSQGRSSTRATIPGLHRLAHPAPGGLRETASGVISAAVQNLRRRVNLRETVGQRLARTQPVGNLAYMRTDGSLVDDTHDTRTSEERARTAHFHQAGEALGLDDLQRMRDKLAQSDNERVRAYAPLLAEVAAKVNRYLEAPWEESQTPENQRLLTAIRDASTPIYERAQDEYDHDLMKADEFERIVKQFEIMYRQLPEPGEQRRQPIRLPSFTSLVSQEEWRGDPDLPDTRAAGR